MQKPKNETAPQYVATAILNKVSKQKTTDLLGGIEVAQSDFNKRPTAIQAEYVTYYLWYWLQEYNIEDSSIFRLMASEFEKKVAAKEPNWQFYFYYQKVLEGLNKVMLDFAMQDLMP